ncbi:MAG: hypothetical protein NC181_04335 [Clostridium sp.]|nr:hypothetical protein [Clostridium sp.]MCM1444533.1 hypothetical protein [Candidatus Amulumruptor caecigallinarius]
MKVSIEDENNFIVFLYNKMFNFQDKDSLEEYFKEIFNKVKSRYHIDISGYYDIKVYKDDIYGIILSISKEDIEYFDYFDDQVEMRIVISPYNKFVYKLENNDINVEFKGFNIYTYLGNIYLIPEQKEKNIEFIKMLEYTTVIYGEEADKIIKCAKKQR